VRVFWLLVRLRVLDSLRGGLSGVLFVAMPLVILGLVALVFANGQPFERRTVLVVAGGVPPDVAAVLAAYPELRVEAEPSEARAMGRLRSRAASAALLPAPAARGWVARVTPNERLLGAGLGHAFGGELSVEVTEVPRWGYVHYIFPGLLTSTALLAGLFGMGYAMVRYRQSLFLKKLATTPLSRSTFVLAQVVARALLVLAQTALLVGTSAVALDLPVTATSAALLAGFVVLGVLVFTGVGFLLACAVKTEGVMVDVINALGTALVFLSEMFFPNDTLPSSLAAVTRLLPSTMMVGAIRAVLVFGETRPSALLQPAVGLAAWAVATYAASLYAFRWDRR
jgi:ABC-type multidrug transport system permease subunit